MGTDNTRRAPRAADVRPCIKCKRGIGHNGAVDFYVLSVARYLIDPHAVNRRHGEELMMGGGKQGALLASVLGVDDPIAIELHAAENLWICGDCMMAPGNVDLAMAVLVEAMDETDLENNTGTPGPGD